MSSRAQLVVDGEVVEEFNFANVSAGKTGDGKHAVITFIIPIE